MKATIKIRTKTTSVLKTILNQFGIYIDVNINIRLN